jgi:Family of unknown function (DUF5908)
MPIEIKELQIKVKISDNEQGGQASGGTASTSNASTPQSGKDKESIVQECVDKVLEILKEKMDR